MSPSTPISAGASSVAAIVGAAPAPTRSAGSDGNSSPAPESFAQALSQASSPTPSEAAAPAAAPRSEPQAEQARPEPSTGEPRPAATPHGAAAARNALQRKVGELVADAATVAAVASGMSPAGTALQPGAAQPSDTPASDQAVDPSDALPDTASLAAAWLAGMPAANERASGKASVPSAGATGNAATALPPARGSGAAAADSANAPPSAATPRRGEASTGAVQAAGEREAVASGASPAPAAPPGPVLAAPMAAALPLPAAPVPGAISNHAAAPAPTEGRLQASPGSLEFAPALGAQLNLFLRDGVQHARLQLHPAELGPLTVQIQLDGATAQVRLAAEHPLTRQALEQAMPTLAGALRESGLTLTGGGVFEQPANPQQQEGRAPAAGRTQGPPDTTNDALEATPRAPLARRGVVDLVA